MATARFRIRAGTREIEVGELSDLVRMLRVGRIGPNTQLFDARDGLWRSVREVPGLEQAMASADPWSAWDEVDATDPGISVMDFEDADGDLGAAYDGAGAPEPDGRRTRGVAAEETETVVARPTLPKNHRPAPVDDPSDLPTEPPRVIEEWPMGDEESPPVGEDIDDAVTEPPDAVDDRAFPSLRPPPPGLVPLLGMAIVPAPPGSVLPDASQEEDGSSASLERDGSLGGDGSLVGPGGKVIAFPTEKLAPRRARTDGAHALAERPVPIRPPRVQATTPVEPPRVRTSIILAALVTGFLGLAWWVWYVDVRSSPQPRVGNVEIPTARPPRLKDVAMVEPASPARAQMLAVQTEFERILPETVQSVTSESEMENGLTAELASLGVDVVEVDAAVLSWTPAEPEGRAPQVVEFRVRLQPEGLQLSPRDQGAVALVVGRTIDAYDLVVTRFEIVLEAENALPRTVPLDALRAQRLASGEIDLAQYFRVE